MSKAPSMPIFWDSYLADTTHLTTEEHGAYLLLLAAMWRRDGEVPDDDRDNARIVGLTTAKWRKTKARLSTLICADGNTITQKNLKKIWKNTQEKINKNRENGAKGGRANSNNNSDLAQANATETLKPNSSIPEPESDKERKKEPPATAAGTDFSKGLTGKKWIWSEGVDHIIRTSDCNQHQARSKIGYLLKMCDEKPDRLMKFFIEALEQGSTNPEASIKTHAGKMLSAPAGAEHVQVVAIPFHDERYKRLQDRHLKENGKRKFQANGVAHFPKGWVDELAGVSGNA